MEMFNRSSSSSSSELEVSKIRVWKSQKFELYVLKFELHVHLEKMNLKNHYNLKCGKSFCELGRILKNSWTQETDSKIPQKFIRK